MDQSLAYSVVGRQEQENILVSQEKITLSSTLATMPMIGSYLGPTIARIPYIYPYYWLIRW